MSRCIITEAQRLSLDILQFVYTLQRLYNRLFNRLDETF